MATVASINVALNAHTGQFNSAMNGAAKATAQFQAQAKSGASGIGQQIQAAGYAFQDFTSVLQNGGRGALGRAFGSISNNIGQITAGFGPWGAVIGTVAGALGGVLIPRLLETGAAVDKVRESMDKAFEKGIDSGRGAAQFTRRLSELDSKGAAELGQDLQAKAIDLRTELDARRKKFEAEIGGMMGRGELETAWDAPANASPLMRQQGRNGVNVDFNNRFFIPTQGAADRIEELRTKLAEVNDELSLTKDRMQEAMEAGTRQTMLEGVQKELEVFREVKRHEDMMAQQEVNERLALQGKVEARMRSESSATRPATAAASAGSAETYSSIAAASRQNTKSDIQSLIEVEKRIEAEQKKMRKAIEDAFAKQPVVVSAN